jgi:hypothetical protein
VYARAQALLRGCVRRLRALTPPPPPRSANHLNLVVVNNNILFFNIRDGPYFPTLRVLHQCTRARATPFAFAYCVRAHFACAGAPGCPPRTLTPRAVLRAPLPSVLAQTRR